MTLKTKAQTTATTTRLMTAAMPADKSRVTLHLQPGSGAQGQIALTANGLLRLIQTLGRIHASMIAGKAPPQLDAPADEVVFDPAWNVGSGLMGEATTISFHHPGYGVVSFLLPNDQVRAVAAALGTSLLASDDMRRTPKN